MSVSIHSEFQSFSVNFSVSYLRTIIGCVLRVSRCALRVARCELEHSGCKSYLYRSIQDPKSQIRNRIIPPQYPMHHALCSMLSALCFFSVFRIPTSHFYSFPCSPSHLPSFTPSVLSPSRRGVGADPYGPEATFHRTPTRTP